METLLYKDMNEQRVKEYKKQYYEVNKEKYKQYYEDNKEHIKDNSKQHYENNKEHIQQRKSENIVCNMCGCQISRTNMVRHQQTQKCKNKQILS